MKYKILNKQKNSKMCVVCGTENPFGFDARFYETDNHEVIGVFRTKEEQQSYPTRVHGGVISAMLDETIGRVLWIDEPDAWAVTVELSLRYKKPVPLNIENLKCVGRITRNTRKIFEGTGEIYLPDGTVAIEAHGKYWRMNPDEIDADDDILWFESEDDTPDEIEV